MLGQTKILLTFLLAFTAYAQLAPVPGTDRIGSSLDPVRLDVLSQTGASKLPVIKLTYKDGNKIAGANGQVYSYPDQAFVAMRPGGECMSFSTFNSDALGFSEAFAGSVGESESSSSWFGLVQSSKSWTVGAALDLGVHLGSQSALGVAFCNATTHMIELNPWFELKPDDDFATAVSTLLSPNPKYEDNIGNWLEFFENYGMAQPMHIVFGGAAGLVWAMEMETYSASGNGAAWASEQASGALAGLVSGAGGTTSSGNASAVTQEFLDSTKHAHVWVGGSLIPGAGEYSQWYNSLFAEPAALQTRYIPITPFIAMVDANLTQGAEDAIRNISAIAMLESLVAPLLEKYATALQFDPTAWNSSCTALLHENGCTPSNCVLYSDLANLGAQETTAQTGILSAISGITAAVSTNWISQASLTSILDAFAKYSAMWVLGNTTQFICSSSLNAPWNRMTQFAATFPAAFNVVYTVAQSANPLPGTLAPQNVSALTWQYGVYNNPYMDWVAANAYCSSLGTSWRLPSIWELYALYSQWLLGPDDNGDLYWSSTSVAGTAADIWGIEFATGYVLDADLYNQNGVAVRCVASS